MGMCVLGSHLGTAPICRLANLLPCLLVPTFLRTPVSILEPAGLVTAIAVAAGALCLLGLMGPAVAVPATSARDGVAGDAAPLARLAAGTTGLATAGTAGVAAACPPGLAFERFGRLGVVCGVVACWPVTGSGGGGGVAAGAAGGAGGAVGGAAC